MAFVSGRRRQQGRLESQDQSRRGLECQVQGSYFNCPFLFQQEDVLRATMLRKGTCMQVKQGGRIWQQRDQVRGFCGDSGAAESRVAAVEMAGGGWT